MNRSLRILSLAALVLALPLVSCQREPAAPPAAETAATAPQAAAAAPPDDVSTASDPSNPCNTGPDNNPNQPILCIDDTDLTKITVDPTADVHVNAQRTVHWFTKSGSGTIGIIYDSELLDAPDEKPGKGHTKAKAGTAAGSVKYSIVVMKGAQTSNVIDPTIIIDTNPAPE
jgi:hypothetical protein